MLPRHPSNPVGQTRRIKAARSAAFRDIERAQTVALETLASWPTVIQNGRILNRAFYDYQIDLNALNALVRAIESILANGGGPNETRRAVEAAYREGTAKAAENLAGLLEDLTREATQRLGQQLVLRRAALAGARAFELMEGFAGSTAADLGRVLFQAVQDGENPRETAKTIRERFRVSKTRAERIARTEITGALRRGRWDEAREVEREFGKEVRLIHYSALIPGRTRRSHAQRHGRIVTVDEQAEWYASDANAINCLCSQTEVTVDENGEPIFGKALLKRMAKQKAAFLGVPVEEVRPATPAIPKPVQSPRESALQSLNSMPNFKAAGATAAFSNAPLPALRAMARDGDMGNFTRSTKADAFHLQGSIEMGTDFGDPATSVAYQNVFRHEAGHLVDRRIALGMGRGNFASWAALDDLIEDGKAAIKNRTGGFDVDWWRPARGGALSRKQKAESDRLYDARQKRSSQVAALARKMRRGLVGDFDDFLLRETGFSKEQVQSILPDIDVDGESGWAEFVVAWKTRDSYLLTHGLQMAYGGRNSHDKIWPGLQDTLEASTGANVRQGFGHGKKYYTQRKALEEKFGRFKKATVGKPTYFTGANTGQAFANWFEAYGSGNSIQYGIFKRLFPKVSARFEAMLEEFVDG